MIRDFSLITKVRLIEEIDKIHKDDWCGFTDFFGDLFYRGGKMLEHLKLKDDMSNVEEYHRKVLDMTDMTKNELNSIFEEVYEIDKTYADQIRTICERFEIYNEKLIVLCNSINPNFTISSAGELRTSLKDLDLRIQAIDRGIDSTFAEELDWAAKKAAKKSFWGFIGGLGKTGFDVITLPCVLIKDVVTNPSAVLSDTWDIVDDVFTVGGNMVGVTALGIGFGFSSLDTRYEALKAGEAYSGAKGLTDVLEAEEEIYGKDTVTDILITASKTVDTVTDTIDMVDTAKTFLESPEKMIDYKFGFSSKMSTIKKADMLEEYQDNYRKYQSLYRRVGKNTNFLVYKNASNAYKFLNSSMSSWANETSVAEGFGKTIVNKGNPWFKAFDDAYELGEEIVEFEPYKNTYVLDEGIAGGGN